MANEIRLGINSIGKFKVGDYDCQIYLGVVKLYPNAVADYLRTVARGSGTISLTIGSAVTTSDMTSIAYSTDGNSWTTLNNVDSTTITASVNVASGDTVYWKGAGVRTAIAAPSYMRRPYNATIFSADTAFDVEGNAMSMLFDDNFEGEEFDSSTTYHLSGLFYSSTNLVGASGMTLPASTLYDNDYNDMFNGCSNLLTPPELPATTIGASCYKRMFQGCTSLSTSPELLATTLAAECYSNMFNGCSSLTTAPDLSATTLITKCYQQMFYGCTSLTTAPSLPATTLANDCYQYMFQNCTSLTIAPSLPATTLANYCYSNMFRGCTSLTTAPYLPATTLVSNCYTYMFYGCSSLNRIECNADTYYSSATAATYNWVSGVAASGKFIKNSSNTWWTTGNNGIPTNWSVGTLPAERTDWVKADVSEYVCVGYDKHYKEYLEETTDGGITWSYVTPLTSRTSSDVIETDSVDCGFVPSFDDYFVITTLAANNTITLKNAAGSTALTGSFSYSLDSGSTWTSFTLARNASQTFTLANVGDKLLLQGVNNTLGTNYNAGHYFRATGDYEISGEISALVNGTGSVEIGSGDSRGFTFAMLFSGDTHLISAENLKISSESLPRSCFNSVFRGCTSLIKAPATLPSTILGAECYSSMFESCTALAYPPTELNFTTISSYGNSYNRMFTMSRNSKVSAAMTYTPKMFGDWGSVAPATRNMQMFAGNGSLQTIYCYWTNSTGTFGNIADWVTNTDDTNVTFYKRSTQSFASGVNGIKDGWTVVNDDTTQPS